MTVRDLIIMLLFLVGRTGIPTLNLTPVFHQVQQRAAAAATVCSVRCVAARGRANELHAAGHDGEGSAASGLPLWHQGPQ